MDPRFLIGLVSSVILIIGAALPDRPAPIAWKSGKNRLFACGSTGMFLYALLGYLSGGPIFFLILQIFVACSTIFMIAGTPDRFDTRALGLIGIGLVLWSLALFRDYSTAIFVCGLVLLGIGFAMKPGTAKRELALTMGSAAIALFSYFAQDWIFVVLNVFFAVLAAVQVRILLHRQGKRPT